MLLHKLKLIIFCGFIFLLLFGTGYTDSLSYNIINSFPSPGPSPQGLTWDGNFLWVVDDSTDSLYKLNTANGTIISSFPAPGPVSRGLTWDGTHLWCQDDIADSIFKLDSTDASVIKSIPAPGNIVLGLTWDGQYLWSAYFAGWSSEVNQVDTTDGTVIRSFFCVANGLSFNGEYLWSVHSQEGAYKGFVKKHDFPTGNVLSYFRTPGYYPTSLTFDGNYFWLADCGADTLYKIEVITTNLKISPNNKLLNSFRISNYPNPFNQQTLILYELPYHCKVTLFIFNINGQFVNTLENTKKNMGFHRVIWNGKNTWGQYVPSGIYFYHIETENFLKSKKMILVR